MDDSEQGASQFLNNNNNHQPMRSSPSNSTTLPPAYAFQRTDEGVLLRPDNGGRVTSFATTEDSIDQSMDRSVDYTEDSTSGPYYEGTQLAQAQRQLQMGVSTNASANNGGGEELNQYYQYQEAQEGYNNNLGDVTQTNNLSTNESYYQTSGGLQGLNSNYTNNEEEEEDATSTISKMHKKLLYVLSNPELFHEALIWQEKLDRGIDPSMEGLPTNNKDKDGNVSKLLNNTTGFETEFDDDSTFRGLVDDDTTTASKDDTKKNVVTRATQDETFEFNPNAKSNEKEDSKKEEPTTKEEEEAKPKEAPLPHQIFASDAEVVLPQALTASQLFGIERVTGIELEAAAGLTGLSQLFLRWIALMPEGDHMNIIDPPGLTVMKISGGGYRVTAAHRVVWRWMNKFSPASTTVRDPVTGTPTNDTDFDFGDLVTMTIIDVFETDAHGKLLSYCPTFDNRAVHKTPETIERLRKGASHLKEQLEGVANSPAGKTASVVRWFVLFVRECLFSCLRSSHLLYKYLMFKNTKPYIHFYLYRRREDLEE